MRQRTGRWRTNGCRLALYSAWRRLTTSVVSSNTARPAPPLSRLRAMNCADPANTKSDIPTVCHGVSPALTARLPKMMPNGMAPISIGSMSRMPCRNS